ncbi:MAG TPA: tagatose 1,6-diphosphate aldolase [Ktedonobacteraceae bacterium]|nr:tagatose 1,6-diphosphate aldolase [Ktedonobacteraceae bacterium]
MKIKMSRGKFEGINACADERGVIAALAVDHRGNLQQAIAEARGTHGSASADDMFAFKTTVTSVLTRHTSAILLDPEYSLEAIASRAPGTGVLLAYEYSGYESAVKDRLPDVLPGWSVRRLVEAGAHAIKILLYYNPFDEARINSIKQAYVERIGAECLALDVPFFLEPLVYDETLGDEKGLAFARKKPEYVTRAMQEFSQPRYGVDVLKVELPVNPAFVAGTRAYTGEGIAYSHQEAIAHFRASASAASLPFIYLSGGAMNEVFCEMLELAAEANVRFAGVLCGRAIWQDAIPIYARAGVEALSHWLEERGTQNIQALNTILARGAAPWWHSYGGQDNIELTEAGS